ncbi:MAG: hypothetical protein AAF203_07155 [Pseudomonadota bacterium]
MFFVTALFQFVSQSFQLSTKTVTSGLNIHQDLFSTYLVVVHYVLVFVIAALSSRFFTEEKRLSTYSLLITSPLLSWHIVFAKWLGGASLVGVLLMISLIFPLSMAYFVPIPWFLLMYSYLGLFLVLNVYIVFAMLASILSDSFIVSVVLALVFSICYLLLGAGAQLTDWPALQSFFSYLSVDQHFALFRVGQWNLASCFYFISVSFFGAFVCERLVELGRWQ